MVEAAQEANGTKVVFVQTWPGLYANTQFNPNAGNNHHASVYPPVANGGEPSPQNNDEWRAALREHFTFAHALFLSIAEANMYGRSVVVLFARGCTCWIPRNAC
jgi:hypothetical protein